MVTKLEDLRPWARHHPRIALASVHIAMIFLWLLSVLYALMGGLQGFWNAWRDEFAEAWAWSNLGMGKTKEILRQEITARKRE